jgi:signal transduction histidine kinase
MKGSYDPEKTGRNKKGRAHRLTQSAAAKATAFTVAVLMLCITALSVVGAITMFTAEVYDSSLEANQYALYSKIAYNDCYNLMRILSASDYNEYGADEFVKYSNIAKIVSKSANPDYHGFERTRGEVDERFVYTFYWYIEYDSEGNVAVFRSLGSSYSPEEYPEKSIYYVTLGVASELTETDDYYWYAVLFNVLYFFRFSVYPIGLAALTSAILCLSFLFISVGRKKDSDKITPTPFTRLPLEIPTLGFAAIVAAGIFALTSVDGIFQIMVIASVWYIFLTVSGILWLMSVALRIKLGVIVKYTVVYFILNGIWRGMRFIGRCIVAVIRALPLIWKTLAALFAVALAEILVFVLARYEADVYLIWWFIVRSVVSLAVIYIAIMLSRLKAGGRKIADGDLGFKIDTEPMLLELREHGEDLNRIGDGMNAAVDERLRSERMNTELITNVSHDIKTPLTSIINYSDLICREKCENESITEYAKALHKQSERMKRLIEDLVEASKASSGNIEINLDRCNAGVMISQMSGEYEQRLFDSGLELVCSAPEREIFIMADGRRIWRVFDNLMSNARKYALSGTRVYVSLDEVEGNAIFCFKNVSREPLTLDASELAERFVRGDKSRNTEGNGLGLSIAKSLVELQGGSFEITVDGDLFKVTLTFAAAKE